MEILFERVSYLCRKYNVTYYAVEKATELSDSSIKRWGKSPPSSDRLLRVAQYFGVSTDFLLGNTDNPKSHLQTESSDCLLKEIKSIATNWKACVTQSSAELEEKLDNILKVYGTKSKSGIEIYSEDVINDPNLPK